MGPFFARFSTFFRCIKRVPHCINNPLEPNFLFDERKIRVRNKINRQKLTLLDFLTLTEMRRIRIYKSLCKRGVPESLRKVSLFNSWSKLILSTLDKSPAAMELFSVTTRFKIKSRQNDSLLQSNLSSRTISKMKLSWPPK